MALRTFLRLGYGFARKAFTRHSCLGLAGAATAGLAEPEGVEPLLTEGTPGRGGSLDKKLCLFLFLLFPEFPIL